MPEKTPTDIVWPNDIANTEIAYELPESLRINEN
jgi:hypothetical protein